MRDRRARRGQKKKKKATNGIKIKTLAPISWFGISCTPCRMLTINKPKRGRKLLKLKVVHQSPCAIMNSPNYHRETRARNDDDDDDDPAFCACLKKGTRTTSLVRRESEQFAATRIRCGKSISNSSDIPDAGARERRTERDRPHTSLLPSLIQRCDDHRRNSY